MADPLEVFALPLGPLQANCFVVVQGQTGLVIDPGDEAHVLIEAFGELGFPPAAVLVPRLQFSFFHTAFPIPGPPLPPVGSRPRHPGQPLLGVVSSEVVA